MNKSVFILHLLFFTTIACASDQAREQQYAAQIEESLVIGEAVRLEAGDVSFLALYTEADEETANAALILHGHGVHPNWADVIFPLRSGLAEHGWATLSLQMPVGERDSSIEDTIPLLPEVPPRIETGIAFLHERGYTNIVLIAHSFGAQMATYYLAHSANPPVGALVAVGLSAAETGLLNTVGFMEKITVPMLDIYGSNDFDSVIATVPQRAGAQTTNAKYSQLQVDGANHFFSSHDDELLEHVRQWLEPFKQ